MDNPNDSILKRYPLTMYFILAFAITWLILSPGVASTLGLLDLQFEGTVLTIMGGLGPLLAALMVTRATQGQTGVRKMLRSMFSRQVQARWWAAAVLLLASLFAIATALGMLTGGLLQIREQGYISMGGIWLSWFCFCSSGHSVKSPAGVALHYPDSKRDEVR